MSRLLPARPAAAVLIVFLAAFGALSFNLWRISIGSGWIDPVLHYGAQDDASYTDEAIRMATRGDWLNPTMLGRWVLEKPPLLPWLSALAMRLFGIDAFTARLPAVLAGSLIATLCFAMAQHLRSTAAGFAAALLCIQNQVLFTMSRHNMTDILLAAAVLVVVALLLYDPALSRWGSRVGFTLAIAAAILTKSIAGALPAVAAILFALTTGKRPLRLIGLSAAAALIGSSWFVYEFVAHREWFLADQRFQIVSIGLEPHQTLAGTKLAFYLVRFLYAAPATLVLGPLGLPRLIAALRRREEPVVLLACFAAVLTAALIAFRFRSITYLTPLFPILILLAVLTAPLLGRWLPAALLAALFLVKAANPARVWGLSYRPGSTIEAADTLSHYCEARRGNDLYILDVDDQFYALVLPLARLHYGWVDRDGSIERLRPHLKYLGILQRAGEPADAAMYAARLRAWGMQSTEALGTGITAPSYESLNELVLAHPESDFLISPSIEARLGGRQSQATVVKSPIFTLLESRVAQPGRTAAWTCRM